ncbi:MAG: M23 family metallopeptidase [Treponema sp.]|uniref:M23 family metallopeptidase n=1 Tax=Treponema sp. TaxID=166 RepID=UPI0025CC162C|nr:M23 family metallopeptidase [Treponema sp.]MBQ8678908.1 M23 family metallopeptidase [Treponema sp.]
MSDYSIKDDYNNISSQLEKKEWGTFPFHLGNFWHSGIHFNTRGQKKIHPILNGKVIAYRIRDKEKEVDLAELLSEVEFKALEEKTKEYYDEKFELKDKQSAPKKRVSDSFVLLKHEITRYKPSLVFYTLYMNLAAVTSDDIKYYPEIKDNLNKFILCNPELDNITYIPAGFKNNGEEYVELILFTESKDSITSHKVDGELKIFKPIPTTEQILSGTKKDIKPLENIKYLIPNNSDYEKKNYSTDGAEFAVEIELKSFNAMVKIVQENKTRTLWWVSASDYYEDGIKRDFSRPDSNKKAEGLLYIIDLLKESSFVEKCEAKKSSYMTVSRDCGKPERTNIIFSEIGVKDNPKFWTKKTQCFNAEIGKTGKAECFDGNHAYNILSEIYDENPFQFSFKEVSKDDLNCDEIEIKDTTLYEGEINGTKVQCYKAIYNESEYFIKKEVADSYLVDAYDFSQWFIDLTTKSGMSEGIICDKKNVYESLGLSEEINTVIQGDFTLGDFKLLLGSDNSSEELRKIRRTLRTVICRHPLEWDETLFASASFNQDYRKVNRQTAIISEAQSKNLKTAAKDTDIWKDGLQKVFSTNEFNFFHPLYFLNYLDKIGMLEFNPYAGKKIVIEEDYKILEVNDKKIEYGTPYKTFLVKDNPGFAPVTTSTESVYPYAGQNFTKVTGGFKDNYSKVLCNKSKCLRYCDKKDLDGNDNPSYDPNKQHVGVDFSGRKGESVLSLISGKVLGYGIFGNYGQAVIVGHSSGIGVYVAAHLSEYNEKILKKDEVSPGDVIGYIGGTGANGEERYDTHLHVTYYKYSWKDSKHKNNNPITNRSFAIDLVASTANPFEHTEGF